MEVNVYLPDIVGRGYGEFWRTKKRYRVVKGGRASKKSRTCGINFPYNIMKYPDSNLLVIRKTFNTHKDSTFAVLKWGIHRLKADHLWQAKESPLELIYKPTGQKILFRGLDDPLKLTSITVDKGVLCWVWIEEAFEIDDEDDFDMIDESVRGELPEGLWKQITLSYNPWVNTHWTKTRFFDNEDPNAFTLTTTYKCNEWLDNADRKKIEDLQYTNPERYKVVGLGDYGLPGGTFYEEFRSDIHVVEPFKIPDHYKRFRSMDYGLDMLAVPWFAVDEAGDLVIYRELYEPGLGLTDAAKLVNQKTPSNEVISYTVASPDLWKQERKDGRQGKHEVDYMIEAGLNGLRKADNARIPGWRNLREYLKPIPLIDRVTGRPIMNDLGNPVLTARLRIFKTCTNCIRTLSSIVHDENEYEDVADEPHELTHMPEAIRYGCMSRPPRAVQKVEIPGASRRDMHLRHPIHGNQREVTSDATGY
jgi:phage terminase large subunit